MPRYSAIHTLHVHEADRRMFRVRRSTVHVAVPPYAPYAPNKPLLPHRAAGPAAPGQRYSSAVQRRYLMLSDVPGWPDTARRCH